MNITKIVTTHLNGWNPIFYKRVNDYYYDNIELIYNGEILSNTI